MESLRSREGAKLDKMSNSYKIKSRLRCHWLSVLLVLDHLTVSTNRDGYILFWQLAKESAKGFSSERVHTIQSSVSVIIVIKGRQKKTLPPMYQRPDHHIKMSDEAEMLGIEIRHNDEWWRHREELWRHDVIESNPAYLNDRERHSSCEMNRC